jgi:hypothetical protein
LYSSPDIIRINKLKRRRCVGHVGRSKGNDEFVKKLWMEILKERVQSERIRIN